MGKLRISCSKPQRVLDKFDGQEIDGVKLFNPQTLGLQVSFDYEANEDWDEDEVKGKIRAFMKKDEVFSGLMTNIEVYE